MTPNPSFKVTVFLKGEYLTSYCPNAYKFIYLTSSVICRWRTVPRRYLSLLSN